MLGTVFAYGQTASGKTHTMTGDTAHPGILPLATKHIFGEIAKKQHFQFLLHVSYIEVFNEVCMNWSRSLSSSKDILSASERPVKRPNQQQPSHSRRQRQGTTVHLLFN